MSAIRDALHKAHRGLYDQALAGGEAAEGALVLMHKLLCADPKGPYAAPLNAAILDVVPVARTVLQIANRIAKGAAPSKPVKP